MPRISVLLPVYNGAEFLREAVASILSQTFGDFELLIVDDGSTDESLAIIRALAESDCRIRFDSRPNRGLVKTLNELLDIATSPFIARMDADDIAEPERFQQQLREFEKNESLLAVGSDVYSIDPKGRRLMTITMPHTHDEIDRHTMAVVHGSGMCHPAMMFRSTAFERAGRYREEYWPAEDADLVLRIAEKGSVANIPLPLLSYRSHGSSIGHTNASRQRKAMFKAAASAADRRGHAPPEPSLAVFAESEGVAISSATDREVKWAWWALNNGNVKTARSLAFRAVARAPFNRAAWLVFMCAVRGH